MGLYNYFSFFTNQYIILKTKISRPKKTCSGNRLSTSSDHSLAQEKFAQMVDSVNSNEVTKVACNNLFLELALQGSADTAATKILRVPELQDPSWTKTLISKTLLLAELLISFIGCTFANCID